MATRHKSLRGAPVRTPHGKPAWASFLGIMAILGLSAAGGWLAWRQVRADAVDAATLCPVGGANGTLAILLDLTDPIGATQANVLRAELERLVVESPRGSLVALGRVSDRPEELGAAFALCRPMTGAEGGEWLRNPTQLDRRFQQQFLEPLQAELARMLDSREASQSPIMEGLQALLAATGGAPTHEGAPRRIVVVSDLLQHSAALSFYRGDHWQSFHASPDYARLARNLDGAEMTLIRVPRPGARVDFAAVDDFWVRYLDAQGARSVRVETLGDL